MSNKTYEDSNYNFNISNSVNVDKKPIKIIKKRVDINILKSKLEETKSKELRKNIFILSLLIIGVGFMGIYLSF